MGSQKSNREKLKDGNSKSYSLGRRLGIIVASVLWHPLFVAEDHGGTIFPSKNMNGTLSSLVWRSDPTKARRGNATNKAFER